MGFGSDASSKHIKHNFPTNNNCIKNLFIFLNFYTKNCVETKRVKVILNVVRGQLFVGQA